MASIQEKTEEQAAVAARHLLRSDNIGTLATIYHNGTPGHGHELPSYTPDHQVNEKTAFVKEEGPEGAPFCIFDYYVDIPEANGDPIFFMSTIQKAVTNLNFDNRACFTVRTGPPYTLYNRGYKPTPMSCGRVALNGKVEQITDSSLISAARTAFVNCHPDVRGWIDFKDFHFYRLKVDQVYWVGGFGTTHYIGWVRHSLYSKVPESKLPSPKVGYESIESSTYPSEIKQSNLVAFIDGLFSNERPKSFRIIFYTWIFLFTLFLLSLARF